MHIRSFQPQLQRLEEDMIGSVLATIRKYT